jgi:hypothetical protein
MRERLDECTKQKGLIPVAVVKEQGKAFELTNRSACLITEIAVDHCVFDGSNESRCDYILTAVNQEANIDRAYFVELKGRSGLIKGVRQLLNTIQLLGRHIPSLVWEARLVGARDVPAVRNTAEYRQLKKILMSRGGDMRYTTQIKLTETV